MTPRVRAWGGWLVAGLVCLGLGDATPAWAQAEAVDYYGVDAVGSIRVVFRPDGTVVARADYLPFGEAAESTTGQLPATQFTGQERDPEAAQDYFHARYYQPRHGRFGSVDPIFGNLFDPQQLNRYAYAKNSPLVFVDPAGTNAFSGIPGFCPPEASFGACGGASAFWDTGGGGGGGYAFGGTYFRATQLGYVPGMPGWMAEELTEFNAALDASWEDQLAQQRAAANQPAPSVTTSAAIQLPDGSVVNDTGAVINPLTDILGQAAGVSQAIAGGAVAGVTAAASLPLLTAIRLPFVAAGIRAAAYANPNTIHHMFGASEHHLFLAGSQSSVLRTLSYEVARSFLAGDLGASGPFSSTYTVNGVAVRVTGAIINNTPRISNAYILRR